MDIEAIGRLVLRAWRERGVLPVASRDNEPGTLDDGYAAQDALVAASGEAVVGYKIAATSAAGQAHLRVPHPLAGRLLASRVLSGDGAAPAMVRLDGSRMSLLEVEFAFEMGRDLPPKAEPYRRDEVMAAVAALRLAIEVPDSRFDVVEAAGAPRLAADNACADLFVLGPPAPASWREADLAAHAVSLSINGEMVTSGRGGDALGDPRDALTWLANHLSARGETLAAGQVVTTGVCGKPSPTKAGDVAVADYGPFGTLEIRVG